MFGLPKSTQVDREIPKDKIVRNSIHNEALADVFDNQINTIIWRNKISKDTMDILPGKKFSELQIIELELKENSIDKRALSLIDATIPYYVLYMQHLNDKYQAWIGEKRYTRKSFIATEHYRRTQWISENDFEFPIEERTVDNVYSECVKQVEKYKFNRFQKVIIPSPEALIEYFATTPMSYSYKPVLMLALLQYGGSIMVGQIVSYFCAFYTSRKTANLVVEKGNCIFANSVENYKAMERNVVTNPIKALMGSGFFDYDKEYKIFSLNQTLYDDMTVKQIDILENVCRQRLKEYFSRLQPSEEK